MFENIGGKIKKLAEFICWAGITITVLRNLIGLNSRGFAAIFWMVIGCLASWIGSFFVYGFGELIEKVTSIDKTLKTVNGIPDIRIPDASTDMRDEPVSTRNMQDGSWNQMH